jgi:hypothetical protein
LCAGIVLWSFFANNHLLGFLALGGSVLALTGGEALYADMGHFGRKPIQLAWFCLVLPSLVINYFGQGALLLNKPQAIENPFYLLAPDWALYPMVILSTIATIITFDVTLPSNVASQWPEVQSKLEQIRTDESELNKQLNRHLLKYRLMVQRAYCSM